MKKKFHVGLLTFFLFVSLPFSSAVTLELDSKMAPMTLGHPLINAVESGNTQEVLQLLRAGHPVDSRGAFGVTPLMRAAYHGYDEIVRLLLRVGADVDAVDIGGASALHLATRKQRISTIKLLLEAEVILDVPDEEGWTPLMRATLDGYTDVVELLLAHNAKPQFMNDINESALTLVVRAHDEAMLEIYEQHHAFDTLDNETKARLLALSNPNTPLYSRLNDILYSRATSTPTVTRSQKLKQKKSDNSPTLSEDQVAALPSTLPEETTNLTPEKQKKPIIKKTVTKKTPSKEKASFLEQVMQPFSTVTSALGITESKKEKRQKDTIKLRKKAPSKPLPPSLPPTSEEETELPKITITDGPVKSEKEEFIPTLSPLWDEDKKATVPDVILDDSDSSDSEKTLPPLQVTTHEKKELKQPSLEAPKDDHIEMHEVLPSDALPWREEGSSDAQAMAEIRMPEKEDEAPFIQVTTPSKQKTQKVHIAKAAPPVAKKKPQRTLAPITALAQTEAKKPMPVMTKPAPTFKVQHPSSLFFPSDSKSLKHSVWGQIGSAKTQHSAQQLIGQIQQKLRRMPLRFRVVTQHSGAYTVRFGPIKDRATLQAACKKLSGLGSCKAIHDFGKSHNANNTHHRPYVSPKNRKIGHHQNMYWLQFGSYQSEPQALQQKDRILASKAKIFKDQKRRFVVAVPRFTSGRTPYRLRFGPFSKPPMCDGIALPTDILCLVVKE